MPTRSFSARLTKKQRRAKERDSENIVDQRVSMTALAPKTQRQKDLFEAYENGFNVLAIGSAGTGKTFVSLYLALKDVMAAGSNVERIVVIRSAVQTRDQGFMPGSLKEKMGYYEVPYIDIVNSLFDDRNAYQTMKMNGTIEFMSSSFVRGLTFDNAVIIVDEVQSMNSHEIQSVLTRVGDNTRVIMCGDTKQNDLMKSKYDQTGLPSIVRILRRMDSVKVVEFNIEDVVRSGFVKEFLVAAEELEDA